MHRALVWTSAVVQHRRCAWGNGLLHYETGATSIETDADGCARHDSPAGGAALARWILMVAAIGYPSTNGPDAVTANRNHRTETACQQRSASL